jgi:hypothetical protein
MQQGLVKVDACTSKQNERKRDRHLIAMDRWDHHGGNATLRDLVSRGIATFILRACSTGGDATSAVTLECTML